MIRGAKKKITHTEAILEDQTGGNQEQIHSQFVASTLFMERLVFGDRVAAVLVSRCRSDDKKENEATRTEGPNDSGQSVVLCLPRGVYLLTLLDNGRPTREWKEDEREQPGDVRRKMEWR